MKRLFYLTRSMDSVQEISDDLHKQGVTDWRFHIISKDEAGLYKHHLHSGTVLEKTDLARFMERGAIIGALLGVAVVGVLALIIGFDWPLPAWIALFLFSIIAGAWLAGFGGITNDNYRVRHFRDDIEAGKHLVVVDVPKKHVKEMEQLMAKNHPEAELQGEDTSFNRPFAQSPFERRAKAH